MRVRRSPASARSVWARASRSNRSHHTLYPEGPRLGALTFLRKLALIGLAIVLAALALLFVRTQPRGDATVFRRGDDISVRATRIYLRPPRFDSRCRAATAGDRLLFDRAMTVV